ncbi:MAG TPA: hypothetical protein VJW96_01545 [Terriglobales bacterium]|nr:hypothetical protein [Terriglobales bacterium]
MILKRLIASLVVLLLACLAVWFGCRVTRRFDQGVMERKTARTTTALIVNKQFVTFSGTQSTYTNDEETEVTIEPWRRNSGEYRVFYRISSFDGIPETYRSEVVQAEQHRQQRFGERFRIVDKHVYDELSRGAVLKVMYRWAGDGEIEVISTEPD